MNVRGLRHRTLARGVGLLEPLTAWLDLERIVREKVAPLPPPGADGGDDDEDGSVKLPLYLHLETAQGTFRGAIVYHTITDLARFLLDRVRKTGIAEVDQALAANQEIRWDHLLAVLPRLVEEDNPNSPLPSYRRSLKEQRPFASLASLRSDLNSRRLVELLQGGLPWYFARCRKNIVIHRDFTEHVGGHAVGRRRFIAGIYSSTAQYSTERETNLIAFDGKDLRIARSFKDLPSRLCEELQARGTLEASPNHELLARPDLEPVALLRVPSKRQALDLLDTLPEPRFKGTGYLMIDTRSPIALPKDVLVIDDPSEVLALVSRTRGSVFVRMDGEYPGTQFLEARPHYVALLRVRA